MIEALAPARTPAADGGNRLHLLVARVAAGDRPAFRVLFAFLALRVWRDAVRVLRYPAEARAVTRSTFVEVWHLSSHHVDSQTDIRTWIKGIAALHAGERLHALDAAGPIPNDEDERVHRELVALLGAGQATIRTGPATFARVDDLDLDLLTNRTPPTA